MSEPLSHPIEAWLDSDLAIIEADAVLRRLHIRAHGAETGPLAIPQLAALCQAALRFGTLVARSALIADDDHDIFVWAEAQPDEQGVHLVIRSWREAEVDRPSGALARAQRRNDRSGGLIQPDWQMQLDSALSIIGLDEPSRLLLGDDAIGKALTDIFHLDEAESRGGLLAAIGERQPFHNQPVRLRADNRAMNLAGRPLFDGPDRFSGYLCQLSERKGPFSLSASPPVMQEKLLSSETFSPEFTSALRQPVGRILANAETIHGKLHGALREGYANYAGDIVQAAQHLRALIDDISDLEAIDRPNFAPQPDDIDLADMGRRAAGLMAVKASDHQMRIKAPEADEYVPATGEFRRVLQILVNLLTNAIRYSPDGSTISITARTESDRAQIRVSDEGDGIEPDDRERIFRKFERLGRDGDGGSGLGLYISRRIATALGGSLTVEASGSEGSTFLLDLPARKV